MRHKQLGTKIRKDAAKRLRIYAGAQPVDISASVHTLRAHTISPDESEINTVAEIRL
ncbi:hypothetical protein F442_01447 [Phytophthora nicotianae P10297]|uniref:Uncharacterized protein n=1 Tax=Phytophthora nicotianae P10297 TaxID=1317064 RepID=W3A376_PHYNI|nr:hypothetical protein F442_01447 [Phytophthora nicotianae P10297]